MVHSPVKFTANIMKLPPQQQHNNRIYMAFMIRMSVRTQSGSVWREYNAIQHFSFPRLYYAPCCYFCDCFMAFREKWALTSGIY